MDKNKNSTLIKYKTEEMYKKYAAMVHVVVLLIFNVLIVFICMYPLSLPCLRAGPRLGCKLHNNQKDFMIQSLTLFHSLCAVHGPWEMT
jgi:hypothetical protein